MAELKSVQAVLTGSTFFRLATVVPIILEKSEGFLNKKAFKSVFDAVNVPFHYHSFLFPDTDLHL